MGISYKWKLFEKKSKIESNACFFMESVFIKKLYRFQSLWKVFCYVLKLESILKKKNFRFQFSYGESDNTSDILHQIRLRAGSHVR